MYNIILTLHVLVVICLVGVILVQRGRSGGLVEALGGVESIFGTKTSNFFVKATVVLAILFFTTSISLAYLSKQKGKSLISKYEAQAESQELLNVETLPLADESQTVQESSGSILDEVLTAETVEKALPSEATSEVVPE